MNILYKQQYLEKTISFLRMNILYKKKYLEQIRKNDIFSFVCILYKHDPGFGRKQQASALMRFLDNFPWKNSSISNHIDARYLFSTEKNKTTTII